MTTEQRVLKAIERFEAPMAAEGRTKCPCCGNWHRCPERDACNEIRPTTTLAMVIRLAMLAR